MRRRRAEHPPTWLPSTLAGRRSKRAASASVHTLLVGALATTNDTVDIRIVAAVGYRAGLASTDPELRQAANLVAAPLAREYAKTETTTEVYIADGQVDATLWSPIADLAVLPATDGAPTLRLQTHSGDPLPPGICHAVENTDRIVVLTDEPQHQHAQDTALNADWRTVILFTAASSV